MAKPTGLPPSAEYLQSDPPSLWMSSTTDWKDGNLQLKVLEARARQAITKLGKLIQRGIPWKDLNMECVAVSRAHIETFVLRTFITIISLAESTLQPILTKLRNLVMYLFTYLILVCAPYPK
jgi:hypothetical protein